MVSINILNNIFLIIYVYVVDLKIVYCKVFEIWIKVFQIFDVIIIINYSDKVKVVFLIYFIIIMIMSWCDFDSI